MAYVSYDNLGRVLERYEPAWVREVPPTKTRKTRRYEVWQNSRLIATKYTKVSAANLAEGLNKLMKD